MTISNQLALITGAAGSLGSALAKTLACEGWDTVLIDRDKKKLNAVSDEITSAGGSPPYLHYADLAETAPDDCKSWAEAIGRSHGKLDALLHCAVHFSGLQPLEQINPSEWLRSLQVNLNVPWLLTQTMLDLLRLSPNSTLVFFTDNESILERGYWGGYSVSKAGINCLASQFSSQLAGSSIRTFLVDPGAFRSDTRSLGYHAENPASIADALEVSKSIFERLLSGEKPGGYRQPAN